MTEERQRRVVVRRGNTIANQESLDSRISQALASHRLLLASTGRADRLMNASQASAAGGRVMMTVPEGMTGCSTSMFKVEFTLNQDIQHRRYTIESRVRKVIQGGPAGKSINALDAEDYESNVFRVMESRTEAPIPNSVIEDLNYQGIITAGVSLLKGHMPTVDIQLWAFEFAEQLVNWSAHSMEGPTSSRYGPLGAQLAVDMEAAREVLPGLNQWVMTKAIADFPHDAAHYENSPVNCMADLVIVQFCASMGVE